MFPRYEYHFQKMLFAFLVLRQPSVEAMKYPNEETNEICRKLLQEEYKIHEAPRLNGAPLNIFCRMHIVDLNDINEGVMEFRLNTYMGFTWVDPRLAPNVSILFNPCAEFIWRPNTLYEHTKEVYRFDKMYFNATRQLVQMSEKMIFRVPCDMHFEHYPFDAQHCDFSIGLMSTPDYEITLKWYDDKNNPHKLKASVTYEKNITSLQFYLPSPTLSNQAKIYFDRDKYTYLVISFTLVRRLMGSLLNIYIPSTLIVAVSWLNFWIRVDAAPARVALSITSLLTLCTQIQQHKSQLPPINYITAMDIWIFVCIVTVFATFVEFAFAYTCSATPGVKIIPEHMKPNVASRMSCVDIIMGEKKQITSKSPTHLKQWAEDIPTDKAFPSHNRIDQVCRVLFPVAFFIFAVSYGSYYGSLRRI